MEIVVNSPKHGKHIVLIDDEDFSLLDGYAVTVWGTPRHHSLYAMLQFKGKSTRLHRLIMNAPKGSVVDHINGNGLDNRKCNLRITTQSGNNKNARKRISAETSQYKGVHLDRIWKTWKAQIQVNKKKIALGTFKTELEAAKAYNEAAIKHFGEFAVLNVI